MSKPKLSDFYLWQQSNFSCFSPIYLVAILPDCSMGIIVPLFQSGIKKRPSLNGLFKKVLTPCSPSVNFQSRHFAMLF
jgi:hypothetical protein